jgi:hypothetical protein
MQKYYNLNFGIMNKKELKSAIRNIFANVTKELAGKRLEPVNVWFGQTIPTVFAYGAISEHCMEKQLKDLKGCKRQTTFMSDFSIGEWCTGVRGLFETIENGFFVMVL